MAQMAVKDGIEFVPMQWSKCAPRRCFLGVCALSARCLLRTGCGLPAAAAPLLPTAAAAATMPPVCVARKLLSTFPRLARSIVQVEHCRPGQAHGLPPAGQPRAAGVQRGAEMQLGEHCEVSFMPCRHTSSCAWVPRPLFRMRAQHHQLLPAR